jgi:excinuclease ABC subunit B
MKTKRGFRITFFGDEVERIMQFSPVTGEVFDEPKEISIYPAKQYLTASDKIEGCDRRYRSGIGGAPQILQGDGQAA